MMPPNGTDLLHAVRHWIAQDPDPATRHELETLLATALDTTSEEKTATAAVGQLAQRFSGTLEFGTAGLRAALGAGPLRMNRVVVQRAAAGVAAHVVDVVGDHTSPAPRAVIGYDARHNSEVFARDTAAIFTAAGLDTLLMPCPFPTPVLAWAVRKYDADVGVMVTASHNPAADNGYKIYLGSRAVEECGRGCQIVAPHDSQIAAHIATITDVRDIPQADCGWTLLPRSVEQDYLTAILPKPLEPPAPLRIVVTAMHGVGGPTVLAALSRAGFTDLHPVTEQHEPDPTFPTVTFPNPEEPGALDLALAHAHRVNADLVIANDPDADRCAIAVPDPAHPSALNGWRTLRGDEVGVLLGAAVLQKLSRDTPQAVVANSLVSSRMLGRMAAAAGVDHQQTLTGFKWIARVPHMAYGYEEALGYCVNPQIVRDKDGISAAVAIAQLAGRAAARGASLPDELDALAVKHGVFATDQLSIRVDDLTLMTRMMSVLRENTPTELAGSAVVEVRDLAQPSARAPLPPTEGILLITQDDSRVIVRPSGTEPKIKCYVETVTNVCDAADLTEARATGAARLHTIISDLQNLLSV